MRSSRLFGIAALLSSFAWVLAGGCSSGDSEPSRPPGGAGSGSMSDAMEDLNVLMPDPSGMQGGAGNSLNALCGEGTCIPDLRRSCERYEPAQEPTPAGGANGAGGAAGAGGDGGEGGMSGSGQAQAGAPAGQGGASAGEGGASGAAGEGGAGAGAGGGEAGAGGQPPSAPVKYSCQVAIGGNPQTRRCELAGSGVANAPCFSAADCEAGLACVTEGEAGRCLPYCCQGDGSCGAGSYCAERPLRKPQGDTSGAEVPRVPVCAPADDCSLAEPYPCGEGMDCRCKGDTACMVVRADRTTACIEPGEGQQGDSCSGVGSIGGKGCAWNHVCSSVTEKCVKICRTDPGANDCGKQKCQASSELPQNFGVCVGPL